MTQRTTSELKAFFETGDRPTQVEFGDFIESTKLYKEPVVFNQTQELVYLPADTGGTAHYNALDAAISGASHGDFIHLESIQADAGANTLTVNKNVTLNASNSSITRSGDTDYLVYINTAGEVTINGFVMDGGRGDANSENWTTNRGEILRVSSIVDRICLKDTTLQNGPHLGSSNSAYGALIQSEEAYLDNVYFNNAGKFHLRFDGQTLRTIGLRSDITEVRTTEIQGITNANPGVVTSSGHGWPDGFQVVLVNVSGMTQVNDEQYTVANATTDTFELQGEDTGGYGTYTGNGEVGYRQRHLTTANSSNHTNQTLIHTAPRFKSEVGNGQCNLATIDNDANEPARHFEINSAVADWGASTSSSQALIKVEGVINTILRDIIHIGDSLKNNAIFLNLSGTSSDFKIYNVQSPGNFEVINTTKSLCVYDSCFGVKADGVTRATIVSITNTNNTHRIGRIHFQNTLFAGMTANAFENSTPDDIDQRITYKSLTLEFDSVSTRYVFNLPLHTHHFTGTDLRVSNVGAGGWTLSNNSNRRLLLSHSGSDPKIIKYGVRIGGHPQANTATPYGTSTSGTHHPTAAGGFPSVSGYFGDIIENCDPANGEHAAGWVRDATGWIER